MCKCANQATSGRCTICLDEGGSPTPIQCGCACRGDSGWAHIACKAALAKHLGKGRFSEAWATCMTCKQQYTGAMKVGLARAGWALHKKNAAGNASRLAAQNTLALAYTQEGLYMEAEPLLREILMTQRKVPGKDDEGALVVASNLAHVLLCQQKNKQAEAAFRDTLAKQKHILGLEHPVTLTTAGNLATALQNQQKHSEASALLRDTLAVQQRVVGCDHYSTMRTAQNLGVVLTQMNHLGEAEPICCGALARSKRVLGPDHPNTLRACFNLAVMLVEQRRHTKAAAMLRDTLDKQRRMLGTHHPDTEQTAKFLRDQATHACQTPLEMVQC